MSLAEALVDTFRVDYYSGYLESVQSALSEGVVIKGYFAWSLMVRKGREGGGGGCSECVVLVYIPCRGGILYHIMGSSVDRIISNGPMAITIASVCIMW